MVAKNDAKIDEQADRLVHDLLEILGGSGGETQQVLQVVHRATGSRVVDHAIRTLSRDRIRRWCREIRRRCNLT